MNESPKKTWKKKYSSVEQLDPEQKSYIKESAKNGELACAVAFKIVQERNITPSEVGMYADLMKIRLVKCQMGLFGYQPEKKIIKKGGDVSKPLEKAINSKTVNGKLSCENAWQVASELGMNKLAVSNACETLSIKINKCQIGAF